MSHCADRIDCVDLQLELIEKGFTILIEPFMDGVMVDITKDEFTVCCSGKLFSALRGAYRQWKTATGEA